MNPCSTGTRPWKMCRSEPQIPLASTLIERVVRRPELGRGLLLDPDLAGSLKGDGTHRVEPYRRGGPRRI